MTHRKTYLGLLFLILAGGVAGAALQLADPGTDMTKAAEAYLSTLSDEQRAQSTMEYGSAERVDWHFIPKESRKGLQIKEMNAAQRQAAHQLLRAALSEVGYEKAVKVMALEALLAELEKERRGGPLRDAERYYFTVFGEPSPEGRWGLSVEGHHLSLNFAVADGSVSSTTPTFYGANPAIVKSDVPAGIEAIKKGTRVLGAEEVLAFKLLHALKGQQREAAVIAETAPSEIRTAGEPEPPQTAGEGITMDQLSEEQRRILTELVTAYAVNVPEKIAAARLEQFRSSDPSKVYFAWAGADQPGIGHYYRIEAPAFVIEFVNTQPDSAGNPANHIHSVWRDLKSDFAL